MIIISIITTTIFIIITDRNLAASFISIIMNGVVGGIHGAHGGPIAIIENGGADCYHVHG